MSPNPVDGEPSAEGLPSVPAPSSPAYSPAPPAWAAPPAYPAQGSGAPWQAAPGWPPYGQPPPPRRSNRVAWIIGSAVVFLLLACLGLGAVGYVASRQAKGSAATGDPAATSTTYPRTSPVHAHTGSLERYVVPVPPGSRKWPDKPEKEELPDLETASGNAPAFKAILSRYEFQRGYAHRWIDSKGTIVDARLFQFQDAENADNFARIMGVSAEAVGWGKATPVPGADGAFVQIQAKRDDYGRIRSKGLVLSDDVVVIVDYFALPPNDPKILDALLTKESQLLH